MEEKKGGNMKRYEVIEDNGGGLTLVVFNIAGNVEYIHTGYEHSLYQLSEDLERLKTGDNLVKNWEGNEENVLALYENITSFEYGWKIVADNNGIYPEKMGVAACLEFKIK